MKPLLLHYYITNRCNARCSFCTIWKEHSKTDAQEEEVIANLVEARNAGCRFVDFTGGEPLLHEALPRFLKKARDLGYVTSVTTNTILFVKRARELSGLIDLLHFSIDADNAELHNKIHGVNCYDSVLQSIATAGKHGLVPDLLFTYMDSNIDSFTGIYRLAQQYSLMVILDPVFNTHGHDMVSQHTHNKARAYAALPGVYLNTAHLVLRKKGGNSVKKPLCRAVNSTLVILPDNSLAIPCFHHRIDSISLSKSLKYALTSSKRMLAAKKQGRYPFCNGCHINCYFDPSYTALCTTPYFFKSLYAKFKYAFRKYVVYKHPIPSSCLPSTAWKKNPKSMNQKEKCCSRDT